MAKAETKRKREPLLHVTKKPDVVGFKSLLMNIAAILIALIFSGVLITILSGFNPIQVYVKMYEGTFGGEMTWLKSLNSVAILLIISLAVTPAFKMKFWNIGAEGQVLMGGLATTYVMMTLGNYLYESILLILMFIIAMLVGMVWAVIPAIFKAFWNTNETLFTLMMNYVATALVGYYLLKNSDRKDIGIINERTEYGYLPKLLKTDYLLNILIVVIVTVLMYVYLKYSKQGYEISVVGESQNTARYIGINVKGVIIRTMLISGAICGLAGLLLVAGSSTPTLTEDLVKGQGFTAILVSWMAKFNPLTIVLVSFLIVFMRDGGAAATDAFKIDSSIGEVLTAVVIFSIIICEFFTRYKITFRNRKKGDK